MAVFLNEQVRNSITELASRVDDLDIEVIEDVIIKHSISDLDILAAPQRPEQADSVTAGEFSKLLKYLRKLYKYIIVDTSSYLTGAVMAALDEADLILLLTSQKHPGHQERQLFPQPDRFFRDSAQPHYVHYEQIRQENCHLP